MNIQALADEIPVQGEHTLAGLDFITSGDQYLTFMLAKEHYAVDILCVEEIRCWENPTIIPNAPDHIKGVINMRGIIVPIVDLRQKFNIGELQYTATTVVIVLTIELVDEERKKTIGFVVDAVSDVLNVEPNEVKPAPTFGTGIPIDFVNGLVNVGDGVVTVLNVNALQVIEPHKVN